MGKVDARPVVAVGIANPLDPLSTRTRREFAPGCTVRECVNAIWPLLPTGRELTIAIDGTPQDDARAALGRVLIAGQSVVFTARPMGGGGGGKNIFSTVSMIALMVAAPYAVAPLTPYFAAAGGGSIFGGSLAFTMQAVGGVFSMGAGMLISAFTGTGAQSSSATAAGSVEAQSPSWSDAPNPVTEGGCWPVIYGTAKMKPITLAWHKTYDGEKQYLHWLGAIADHAVDAIDENLIEINGNPRSFYGDSVVVEQRNGALDQTPISFFNETMSEKSVNMKLSTEYVTARTDGNACQGLAVVLCWTAGLGYVGDKGEFEAITQKLSLQRRKVGATDWTDIGAAEELVTANTGSRFYRVFRVDNVDENGAQFDVRVKFTEAPQTGTRYRSDCYLVGIQEIIYDDFAYPGRSVLGLKILADDIINTSTSLTIEAVVTRSTVPVWTGSAYENKPADNPAWASWDFQHNADYGGATPAERIVYQDFEDWADWLATKPLYRVNLCMDSVSLNGSWMDQIAMLGRGAVRQLGAKYTCIVERPEPVPAQRFMFNVANIRRYSFKEKMLPMDDRATCVEVTYRDKDSGYSEQTVTLYAQNYDTSTEQAKATQVKLLGCDNAAQALAHAKSLLNKNRYLTNTVTFGADVDAIGVWPGQIIDVAHDLPQWGFSGLVLESTENVTVDGVTTATLTLDREVDLAPGTSYAVQVKLDDDTRLEYPVQDVAEATTTDVLTIDGGWDEGGQPEPDALYSFGPVGQITKPFTVLSINRADDFTRTLTCLEYNENIFDDEVDVPVVVNPSQLAFVTGLGAVENFTVVGGVNITRVDLAWRGIGLSWGVSYRESGATAWVPLGVASVPFWSVGQPAIVPGRSYEFRVSSGAESETVELAVYGPTLPPPPLSALYRQGDAIVWSYDDAPVDLAGYRVRVCGGLTRNWDKGADWPNTGAVVTERSIDARALGSGVTTVMVKPVDTSGNEAEGAVCLTINLGEYDPANLIATTDLKALGFPGVVLGGDVDGDGNLAASDTGDAYLPDSSAFYLPQPGALYLPLAYGGMSYQFEYIPDAEDVPGTAYLDLAVSGDGWTVSYRRRGTPDLYLGHDDEPYLPDDSAPYLAGATPWAGYSGGVDVRREKLDFLIQTDSGNRQGVINQLTVNIDVEDIIESFEDLVISSTGTRVPITKSYRRIDQVGAITLQDDGHGATGIKIMDKDPVLGPLLAAVGASQSTIDIHNLKGH